MSATLGFKLESNDTCSCTVGNREIACSKGCAPDLGK